MESRITPIPRFYPKVGEYPRFSEYAPRLSLGDVRRRLSKKERSIHDRALDPSDDRNEESKECRGMEDNFSPAKYATQTLQCGVLWL